MTLREKQSLFVILIGKLIKFASESGCQLTFGEAWRSDETAKANAKSGKGISNSLHRIRLAIDLNLFKNGRFIDSSEGHRKLGEYWKSLGAAYGVKTCWGGDFKKPDGNHYSIEHEGVK